MHVLLLYWDPFNKFCEGHLVIHLLRFRAFVRRNGAIPRVTREDPNLKWLLRLPSPNLNSAFSQ